MTNGLNQKAWVVFTGKTDIAWLRILKSGFRHCFIIINDGDRWMSIDPISPYTDIQIYHHITSDFNLPKWLERRGYRVVSSIMNKAHKKPAPCMFVTCVELVKRVLGIHKRTIVTPWQLYNFLIKENSKYTTIKNSKGELSWVS